MSDINFDDILNQSAESIQEPKTLPAGTYHGSIKSVAMDKSAKKGTPLIRMVFALEAAGDDVLPEALEEAGGLTRGGGAAKELRKEYYFNPEEKNFGIALKRVLDTAGVGTMTYREIIESGALTGRPVTISVGHETYQVEGEMRFRAQVNSVIVN